MKKMIWNSSDKLSKFVQADKLKHPVLSNTLVFYTCCLVQKASVHYLLYKGIHFSGRQDIG